LNYSDVLLCVAAVLSSSYISLTFRWSRANSDCSNLLIIE